MNMNNKIFFKNYIENLNQCYSRLDINKIENITELVFKKIKSKNNIFVCGNGGSASISNHFLCDFNKGIKFSSTKKLLPKIISLSNSIELITAISNDISFEKIFSYQFENYVKKDDLLLVFSCSGNSKNIKNIENLANKKNIKVVKFYGFKNSYKNKKNEIIFNLNLEIKNYGICEDVFQSLMHMISQNIRAKYIKNFNFKKNSL